MPFVPCLSVADTTVSLNFYKEIGFTTDSSTAHAGDDLHLLLYDGDLCCMIYGNENLKDWLPCLKDQPVGFSGMFYLNIDNIQEAYETISQKAKVIKPLTSDNNGQVEFYIRDPDGYVLGFNDKSVLKSSELGKYT
ncbi:uncharacterized protein N7498_006451 [Penicillium cinerascens]|uniref:Glyoxalase/fosfomycin resistance/dioxygenase domain-containing protein n=1 Tax=Penicillium cinerascens TaxID=70096 RepID=A0A9W9MI65_9EURO|nr:uncharacterized protein N7498_006451 [Penicillium cinerascens]KAJ5201788.1 hypothetical protein N7498_006451 [Penicillium cinerascens]